MSKQLKDYINFYIGQKCVNEFMDGAINVISGVSRMGDFCMVDKKPEDVKPDNSVVTHDGVTHNFYAEGLTVACPIGLIKPILRKVSSLTFEERKQIWEIVFRRKWADSGIENFHESRGQRWVMRSGVERLGIQFDGRVWADSDMQMWDFSSHEVTRYLCSVGIDCFGLIIEGLAVNSETIKQQ